MAGKYGWDYYLNRKWADPETAYADLEAVLEHQQSGEETEEQMASRLEDRKRLKSRQVRVKELQRINAGPGKELGMDVTQMGLSYDPSIDQDLLRKNFGARPRIFGGEPDERMTYFGEAIEDQHQEGRGLMGLINRLF